MAVMRVAQVAEPGGKFEVVERALPEPGPGHVRIAVEASGICRSDAMFVQGPLPGLTYPVVTGHEVAGHVDAVGEGVSDWSPGDRVEVGWFGGQCGHCRPCRQGDFISCLHLRVPGWAYDGGYATHMVAPVEALARIPDGLEATYAAPLGCAGVTSFMGLRKSAARAGDLVAILGVGGLGHLGIQYASKMGFETVAIARGKDKEPMARQLGADHYIDSQASDPAQALKALGGAKVVLGTAASAAAMTATLDGLAPRGELVVIGVTDQALEVKPLQLITGSQAISGHPSGTADEVEETMRFSVLTGVRPMIETMPLEEVGEAFGRMLSGAARFRMVLTTGV